MRHVAAHGYPVPEVFDADGPDIVMQRIHGRTMLDDMSSRPLSMTAMARVLAESRASRSGCRYLTTTCPSSATAAHSCTSTCIRAT